MNSLLLVFESIGTQELALIVIAALVLFGPRKLPELGRMLGKTLSEFRRASEDFKRTWEMEVELEDAKKQRDEEPQTTELNSPEAVPLDADDAATAPPVTPPLVAKPAGDTVARSSTRQETPNDEGITLREGVTSNT